MALEPGVRCTLDQQAGGVGYYFYALYSSQPASRIDTITKSESCAHPPNDSAELQNARSLNTYSAEHTHTPT
eukprot:15547969-Heterocapsa_arctica.AAC.1